MSRSAILSLLLVTCTAAMLTGCMPNPKWDKAVHSNELDLANLGYHWQNTVPLGRFERITKIQRIDDNLYCLTNNNTLFAFDAKTGTSLWSRHLADKTMPLLGFAHANDVLLPEKITPANVNADENQQRSKKNLVVVTTISDAALLDRENGNILYRIPFSTNKFLANTAPACDSSRMYVGGLRNRCYAYELANGVQSWNVFTRGPLSATPLVKANALFVADELGLVYSQSITSNETTRNWPIKLDTPQTESRIVADMAATDDALYVGSGDYSVYAFQPNTGDRLWRTRCGGPIIDAVLAGRTSVYAYANRDALHALDSATGESKWAMPTGRKVLAETGSTTYVLDDRNYLICVDTETGKADVAIPLTGLNIFQASVADNYIYAASKDGRVCSIKINP